ncbi:hypothetical protein CAPTEDRAFT_181641 [Capitella teleta]|uniref:Uncharacterized protein n=1 Tax=Capitella teleta TaxID=283909 RepID=R7UXD4_CAPTE|nr:hypothetical protein CAPTEDRAFT_181641 [Capitella teleta]|eukprot:ELU11233.1 hypothetical protein CAPTEDRAFT_181641 [Capitella teleta]
MTFLSQSSLLSFLHKRNFSSDEKLKRRFLRQRTHQAKNLFQVDLKGHYGCVNAVEFSNLGGEWIASGGDDRRVLLWHTEGAISQHGTAIEMDHEHNSNIFALAFNGDNTRVISGGNDEIVLVHNIERREAEEIYNLEDAVYGLSTDPINSKIFATACADGRVLIYDTRAPSTEGMNPFCLANYMHPMHCVMYNPVEPRILVTANCKEGLGLWDIRKPRSCVMRYSLAQSSGMSVRFNHSGSHLLALQRRHSPVLFATHSPRPLCFFDHPGYLNSCTMKSCSFTGESDEYALSGSDDFNLYMWKIPEEPTDKPIWIKEAHLVLKGHRSVVNQVRSNPSNQLIISSGVEKIIKMWSPFPLPGGSGGITSDVDKTNRGIYSHEQYINLVRRTGAVMSHDYRHQSTEEDPCMMAFFDSLIQRELEGWGISDASAASDLDIQPGSSPEEGTQEENPMTVAFASLMARQQAADGSLMQLNVSLDDLLNGDGARPRNRSISELIARKRKEFLKGRKKVLKRKRSSLASETKRQKQEHSSSSTSTSSSSASSSSSSSSSPSSSSDSETVISSESRTELIRLQKLRIKVLQSENSSTEDSDSALVKIRVPEIGPHLNEAHVASSKCSKNNSPNNPQPSTSGVGDERFKKCKKFTKKNFRIRQPSDSSSSDDC